MIIPSLHSEKAYVNSSTFDCSSSTDYTNSSNNFIEIVAANKGTVDFKFRKVSESKYIDSVECEGIEDIFKYLEEVEEKIAFFKERVKTEKGFVKLLADLQYRNELLEKETEWLQAENCRLKEKIIKLSKNNY